MPLWEHLEIEEKGHQLASIFNTTSDNDIAGDTDIRSSITSDSDITLLEKLVSATLYY